MRTREDDVLVEMKFLISNYGFKFNGFKQLGNVIIMSYSKDQYRIMISLEGDSYIDSEIHQPFRTGEETGGYVYDGGFNKHITKILSEFKDQEYLNTIAPKTKELYQCLKSKHLSILQRKAVSRELIMLERDMIRLYVERYFPQL